MRTSLVKWRKIAGSLGLVVALQAAAPPALANFSDFHLRPALTLEAPPVVLPTFARGDRTPELATGGLRINAPVFSSMHEKFGGAAVPEQPRSSAQLLLASLSTDIRVMAERFGPSPRQSLAHSDGTPRNLSGSVAIRISSSVHQKNWSRILAEHADRELLRPCDANRPNCRNPRFRSMQQVAHEAAGMDIQAKVQLINSYVNRAIRFEDDIDLYGLADHWATLAETVRHGRGDCEDFAIVKMWLLRAAGVHEQDMHLVIGRETRGERDHAVLAVRVDGQQSLYLDNLADRAYSAHDKDRFAPLVSLGAHGSFIHGYRTGAYELRR